MKAILTLLILFFLFTFTNAQSLADNYLKKIPSLPKDSCNISKEAVETFKESVSILSDEIENDIESLNNAVNEQEPANEKVAKEHAMQQMSQQYGLSQADMNKMESGKMSDADKQALANKILQQQTNMSMGELQNLSKMSEAGKKAYAEALGTEMMATQQANQDKQPVNNPAGDMYKLTQDQQAVMNRLNTVSQKIGNAYNGIESDPELQKMKKNIDCWHSKIMAMTGIDYGQGKQMDSLSHLIKTTQIQICRIYTPKYRSAIRNHLSLMKSSFPDQRKLGEITASLTKIQTGVDMPAESFEIGELESVKGYLNKLMDACQYKLYYPEDDPQ